MLEFRENQPRRKWLPAVLNGIARLLFVGALVAAFIYFRGGRSEPATPAPDSDDAPPQHVIDLTSEGRFGPSDELLRLRLNRIDTPTVEVLAPMVQAAPNSLVLLRYLASIADPRAAATVNARIFDLMPRFTQEPVAFDGKILWLGSRRVSEKPGAPDGERPPAMRHYFTIPSRAADLFEDLAVEARFLDDSGAAIASDNFKFTPDDISVLSYSAAKDSLDFFVERPIPEEAASGDNPSLELNITTK